MKVEFLQEPELEFGVGKHIDIKFGLMDYGPLDFDNPLAPKKIKLGVVGTPGRRLREQQNGLRSVLAGYPQNPANVRICFPASQDSAMVCVCQLIS